MNLNPSTTCSIIISRTPFTTPTFIVVLIWVGSLWIPLSFYELYLKNKFWKAHLYYCTLYFPKIILFAKIFYAGFFSIAFHLFLLVTLLVWRQSSRVLYFQCKKLYPFWLGREKKCFLLNCNLSICNSIINTIAIFVFLY